VSASWSERIVNAAAGVSVLSWAVLGMVFADGAVRMSAVRIGMTVLHLCVGMLFLVRHPLQKDGPVTGMLLVLPSFIAGGFAFKLSPETDLWPLHAEAVFISGVLFVIVSLLHLGRSFAVFPAVRELVASGPYRFLRHPAYAGELVMVLACFLAMPRAVAVLPLLAALPCIMLRVSTEEALLLKEIPAYREYTGKVTWRLLPGVW